MGVMNKRYFKFAREASLKATYRGSKNFAPAIGAAAIYKKSIVATAANTNRARFAISFPYSPSGFSPCKLPV